MILKTTILAEGFLFPEGPRWHEDKLWVSDMQSRWIATVDLQGKTEKIVEVPGPIAACCGSTRRGCQRRPI
jgi:sugar lactone lactonase YvrE